MKPRWILNDPSPGGLPRVGTTVIAKWWPGRYYLVSTIRMDGSSAERRLIQSLKTGVSFGEVGPQPDTFVTQIFKCDKHGMVKSFESPLLERHYSTLQEAEFGHQEAVAEFIRSKR
jgi:hypothetical protein